MRNKPSIWSDKLTSIFHKADMHEKKQDLPIKHTSKTYQLIKIFQGQETPVAFNLDEKAAKTLHNHIRNQMKKLKRPDNDLTPMFESAIFKIVEEK